MSKNLLTKSLFTIAVDCPTKLYYLSHKDYVNNSNEDSFLKALADGGFQVGELAKCYYKAENEGICFEVKERDYEKSFKKTISLLRNENVVIFEAAFKYKDLFVRTDVLEKRGNQVKLIEVKSKSFDPSDKKKSFYSERNKFIRSDWVEYIYDVAFQKYVVEHSLTEIFPALKVNAYLALVDKSKKADIDGLNQKFLVIRDDLFDGESRPIVKIIGDVSKKSLGKTRLLTIQSVDDLINIIQVSERGKEILGREFEDFIGYISHCLKNSTMIKPEPGKECKSCEFITNGKEDSNHKSGFKECWKEYAGLKDEDFNKQFLFNVWNYRDSDKKINNGYYFIDDLKKEDFDITLPLEEHQLSTKERQWLQVDKYKRKDNTPYVYLEGLKHEMASWKYPLHFIDFETSALALPFNKGLHPYEGVAFQFSHHVVYENGQIEHKGEYINDKRGIFPNFDFIKELKRQLVDDKGTIFRYASHENTYLNYIYRQLKESNKTDVSDKVELMEWIKTICTPTEANEDRWDKPKRNMIDLKDIIVKYYYNPLTNGSNSLKYVLPPILNSSKLLQKKYEEPIYGTENGIKSLNYKDWAWIKHDKLGNVIDPYKLLPPIFSFNEDQVMERLFYDEKIDQGGAAMAAYAKMQFSEMSEPERIKLKESLLKYCELDTFAMVLIWEYFNEL